MAKAQPRILVVTDSRDTRTLLEFALSEAGLQVFSAPSKKSALLQIDVVIPHVIVLDSCAPGIVEEDTLHRIREHSTVPVIVLNGVNNPTRRASLEADVAAYLPQPLDVQELYARIQHLLPQ
jgi:DNA-binding response OmpR family regulator